MIKPGDLVVFDGYYYDNKEKKVGAYLGEATVSGTESPKYHVVVPLSGFVEEKDLSKVLVEKKVDLNTCKKLNDREVYYRTLLVPEIWPIDDFDVQIRVRVYGTVNIPLERAHELPSLDLLADVCELKVLVKDKLTSQGQES